MKMGEKEKIEMYTGMTKVKADLERIKKRYRAVQSGASYVRRSPRKAVPGSPEQAKMAQTKRKQDRANQKRKDQELAQTIRDRYRPLLKADIEKIKNYPEEVGSKKSKEQLIKMRKEIFNRRIEIELMKQKEGIELSQ
jgi:hypothetical protein